jgi:hypothetical protein
MWLLNAATLELHEFIGTADRPPYAILSHTWSDDEVSFKDMRSENRAVAKQKKGFAKIQGCCDQAQHDPTTDDNV